MLNDIDDEPDLLKRVITGDESWEYGYDVKTKPQSSQWKYTESPRPKKARQVRSNVKVLLTVLFDSPDFAPYDFFLFPRLKRPMKGRRSVTIEEIKTEWLRELKDIPKSAYQKCFEDWEKRWHKCIISEGNYFEGDNIEIRE